MERVELTTKSFKAVKWSGTASEFEMSEVDDEMERNEIALHIAEDSLEYAERH